MLCRVCGVNHLCDAYPRAHKRFKADADGRGWGETDAVEDLDHPVDRSSGIHRTGNRLIGRHELFGPAPPGVAGPFAAGARVGGSMRPGNRFTAKQRRNNAETDFPT